ncbi:MAG: hypoxanthine phosphoribosyltransferase [Proteobacteria bacterium]|nr:hypoxanthine phosphoribosyltransferase [Pseudomonadota bacterium]
MIKTYIDQNRIQEIVKELGSRISKDYENKKLVIVVLLKGSFIFAADLVRELDVDLTIEFMKVTSYEGEKTTGEVRVIKDLDRNISGCHVLVVEDIVDTGLTLNKILELFKGRSPASLEICSMLDKPSRRVQQVDVKYIGCEIEDRFVIGYGLDFDQKYRQLPYIGELVED